jgi:hypothetical protein
MSISVSNNPDGSITVTCGTETVIFAAPTARDAPSDNKARQPGRHAGGIVVTMAPGAIVPHIGTPVHNTEELINSLKLEVAAANITLPITLAKPKDVYFRLKGLNSFDVGQLSAVMGGDESPIVAHIHIDHG